MINFLFFKKKKIGQAVGQAVGQSGRSRQSVGQRSITGHDRPMTDRDRPIHGGVIGSGHAELLRRRNYYAAVI
jgi:hypothetical protein